MSYKVYKHFNKYSVVKDLHTDQFLVVDVEQGCTVMGSWTASNASQIAKQLESGKLAVEDCAKPWNYDYMQAIDMPKSLKTKQAKMQKAAQKAGVSAGPSKPIGSKAPSIVSVTDKGAFKVLEMDDGTLGVFVPSTGQSKLGMTSKSGATLAGKAMSGKHATGKLAQMGIDPGQDATETLLGVYEDRMREMYAQAHREMAVKQAKFMEKFESDKAKMIARMDAGDITEEQLERWYLTQSAMISRNSAMADALARDLADADRRAVAMLNGYMPAAYAENMNFATYQIERAADVSTSFSLYNSDAVAEIVTDPGAAMLPRVDDAADMAWCRRKVSESMAQSILQGESVPHAAERLAQVVGMSANSAMRAARTALTGAENLGRLDAGRRAQAMGIELKKQWVATVDSRTRHSHRQIDRETVELEEEFSNGCRYPGDPQARGEEVWNCRCAMRYVLPGHEYDDLPAKSREGEDYEEWKNAKKLDEQAKADNIKAQLDALEAQKTKVLEVLPENETYEANTLFKHSTSLDKWEQEQASIIDSKAYCQKKMDELEKLKDASGKFPTKALADKYEHYGIKYDNIDIYDMLGREYHEAHEAVRGQLDAIEARRKELQAKLAKMSGKGGPFSQERLDAARRFATSQEADDALRHISGRAWRDATQAERKAINTYTGGAYSDYNMPLNGYRRSGYDWEYVGIDEVDIDVAGRGREIRDMTTMIEKSVTEEDMWVRRGVSGRTMATFFDQAAGTDLTTLSDETLQQFVGMSNRLGSFQSCGATSSTGFGGRVNLEIFVPKGSEAMYVEPISKCGGGAGLSWDGVSPQRRFSRELETIIQRGGSYMCSKIDRLDDKLNITLELHPEHGYWKFQQGN